MQLFNEWLEEQETTTNIDETIFILVNGTMISGGYDMGMRGIDHNCIISLAPDEMEHTDKWSFIHYNFNIIRLVPETKTALITDRQTLSTYQKEILNNSDYTIEKY